MLIGNKKRNLSSHFQGREVYCDDTPRHVLKVCYKRFQPRGAYLLLCLFFLNLFLRLCVAILCPFFFFPFGIALICFKLLLYLCLIYFFISSMKLFAGLKLGKSCAGIVIVVFFEMLRAVFSARCFTMKLPNPRR